MASAVRDGDSAVAVKVPGWLVAVASALLFLIPALNLVVRHGTSSGYLLLALLSIGFAIANRGSGEYFAPLRTYRWFTVGMLAMLGGAVGQQIVYRFWLPQTFDTLIRFALGLPVFLMLCCIPFRHLRAVGWGCAVGAITVGMTAILYRPPGGWSAMDRFCNSFTNPLPMGNTVLLLAFLALLAAGWDVRRGWAALAVRSIALLLGLYAVYATGARSALILIPVFLILFMAQQGWIFSWKKNVLAVAIIAIGGAGLYSTSYVHSRISDIRSNLVAFQHGDENTAIGLRLQYWQAAWKLFETHPVYGVGRGKIADGINDLIRRNQVRPEAAGEYKHSEFFTTIAGMGLIGIACLLLFYFGMGIYFLRDHRSPDPFVRTAAYGGMAILFSTVIDGLTNDVIALDMTCDLLAALSATLLAMIEVRRREGIARDGARSGGAVACSEVP